MLEHFFGSKTRVKLLRLFFAEPDRSYYVRELARLIEIQLNAVRRELVNLERLGVIRQIDKPTADEQEVVERSKYYVLVPDHLLRTELEAFMRKADLLEQRVFIDEILAKAGVIQLFLLTGVFTRNAQNSPTDLLLVGSLNAPVVEEIIGRFERALGFPIRYTLMDEREYKERQGLGDLFLLNVFKGPRLTLVDRLSL